MPVVGALQAEGLTLTQFVDQLRDEVAKYGVEPYVQVEILQHESQKFFVLGEVEAPGASPVTGGVTLLEGLGAAGGTLSTGALEVRHVIRGAKLMPINVADVPGAARSTATSFCAMVTSSSYRTTIEAAASQ
jgi:protein involved in polysaccharide export with SLBB domain